VNRTVLGVQRDFSQVMALLALGLVALSHVPAARLPSFDRQQLSRVVGDIAVNKVRDGKYNSVLLKRDVEELRKNDCKRKNRRACDDTAQVFRDESMLGVIVRCWKRRKDSNTDNQSCLHRSHLRSTLPSR